MEFGLNQHLVVPSCFCSVPSVLPSKEGLLCVRFCLTMIVVWRSFSGIFDSPSVLRTRDSMMRDSLLVMDNHKVPTPVDRVDTKINANRCLYDDDDSSGGGSCVTATSTLVCESCCKLVDHYEVLAFVVVSSIKVNYQDSIYPHGHASCRQCGRFSPRHQNHGI